MKLWTLKHAKQSVEILYQELNFMTGKELEDREALQIFEETRRRGLQLYAIIHIAVISAS